MGTWIKQGYDPAHLMVACLELLCCRSLTGDRGPLECVVLISEYTLGHSFRFSELTSSFQRLWLPKRDWGNLNSSVFLALHLCSTPTKSKVRLLGVLSSFRPTAPLGMRILCEGSCLKAAGVSFDFLWKTTVFPVLSLIPSSLVGISVVHQLLLALVYLALMQASLLQPLVTVGLGTGSTARKATHIYQC